MNPELHDENGKFKDGNPGGPGRPKGSISIKQEVQKYLESHPHEVKEIVLHFVKNNRELMWQMLEGKPKADVGLGVDKEGLEELTEFFRAMAKKNDGTGSAGV